MIPSPGCVGHFTSAVSASVSPSETWNGISSLLELMVGANAQLPVGSALPMAWIGGRAQPWALQKVV